MDQENIDIIKSNFPEEYTVLNNLYLQGKLSATQLEEAFGNLISACNHASFMDFDSGGHMIPDSIYAGQIAYKKAKRIIDSASKGIEH